MITAWLFKIICLECLYVCNSFCCNGIGNNCPRKYQRIPRSYCQYWCYILVMCLPCSTVSTAPTKSFPLLFLPGQVCRNLSATSSCITIRVDQYTWGPFIHPHPPKYPSRGGGCIEEGGVQNSCRGGGASEHTPPRLPLKCLLAKQWGGRGGYIISPWMPH